MGDKLELVIFEGSTGSNMDKNGHNIIRIYDSEFNDAAFMSISNDLRLYQPAAAWDLFGSESEGLYRLQNKLFDTNDEVSEGKEYLRAILKGRKATHLILVKRFRTESKLQVKDAAIGAGKLTGPGFFMDDTLTVQNRQTLQIAHGVLALTLMGILRFWTQRRFKSKDE